MPRTLAKNNAHFRRALAKLPLGVSSNFRYWGDAKTLYVKTSLGPRLWDLDDNEYIDYRLGYGPVILGHRHPEVDAAARAGQEVGTVFAMSTEREVVVAELISEMVAAAELVRFSNSGTEAVMAALRIARGFTGRERYVIFEGSYHGLFDAVMWQANVEELENPDDEPELLAFGQGVPGFNKQLLHHLPYNDAGRLEELLKRQADTIAAVLIEPLLGSCCGIPSTPEFIHAVRELCTRYGVLMIVDEVKTGFRVARGGAQQHYGVKADLCTVAKAMANGYPIAAIGGREDIMRMCRPGGVTHGGTYTAGGMPLAAAERCLRILRDTDALDRVHAYGRKMQEGMSRILNARGIAHSYAGHPSMNGLFFRSEPPKNYRDWKRSDYTFYDTLAQFLIEHGVLCEPDSREPWFVSAAHDDACLATTLSAFEEGVDWTIRTLAREGRGVHARQEA
jgi:glutamate-1-semialdehyde 2,1-aminomutase